MIAALTTAAQNRFNAFTFAPFDSRPSPPPYSAAFVRHSCLTNTFCNTKTPEPTGLEPTNTIWLSVFTSPLGSVRPTIYCRGGETTPH